MTLTSYDKFAVALGALAVAVCGAAGVHASNVVNALVGIALILLPVFVYYKKNHGLSYKVASKALSTLPAAVIGVFVALHIAIPADLVQIGQTLLAAIPFAVLSVGNSGATLDTSS